MVASHHRLNGHEFEQAPGVGDGQDAWHAAVHEVTKSQTRQREFHFYLLRGRKAMTNLDSILKSRDITLLTKVHIAKAMVFFP